MKVLLSCAASSNRRSWKTPSRRPARSTPLRNFFGMMTSVSTFAAGSGAAMPSTMVKGSTSGQRDKLTAVGEAAAQGGRGHHDRAHQVGPPSAALPPFEVTVRARGAALAGGSNVIIHRQAHQASRLAPVNSALDQH